MSLSTYAPALGLLELESLARGVVVADAVLKRADVTVLWAEAVTPGKYVLLFVGGEAEVAESFQAGLEASGDRLLDSLYLPHISEAVVSALRSELRASSSDESLGLVEVHTVAATLKAADAALKHAQVRLVHLAVAKGIGGKGWFSLAGELPDIEAALEAATATIGASLLAGSEIIARPHGELKIERRTR